MAKQHAFPPFYEEGNQQAAENLRLALPLINKHKAPVTPANYAVWYEYVSGANLALSNAIDALLSKKGAISADMSQFLYEKYVLMNMPERLETTTTELKLVVDNTLNNINHVESTTNQCLSSFNDSQMALEDCDDIDVLKTLISEILVDTQRMSETSNELKQNFEKSSQEITQLRKELDAVKESTQTDSLTGLLNQGSFNHELTNLCQHTHACNSAALVLFEIDNFTGINDAYGYLLGDRVLQFFAETLKKHSGTNQIASRYSENQMALLLINTSLEDAKIIAETIRVNFAKSRIKKRSSDESIGQVTTSIGICMQNKDDAPSDLLDRATDALDHSKHKGKNQISIA